MDGSHLLLPDKIVYVKQVYPYTTRLYLLGLIKHIVLPLPPNDTHYGYSLLGYDFLLPAYHRRTAYQMGFLSQVATYKKHPHVWEAIKDYDWVRDCSTAYHLFRARSVSLSLDIDLEPYESYLPPNKHLYAWQFDVIELSSAMHVTTKRRAKRLSKKILRGYIGDN